MGQKPKKFAIPADQIKRLAPNRGGCFATDKITVDGSKVGYMYRESGDDQFDSGWRFLSGSEPQEYVDDPDHLAVYDVNTIANYDPEIIPFLDAPEGTAFERNSSSGSFVQIDGDPWRPEANSHNIWPPPGFPLVEGEFALTNTWSIRLPLPFARRLENHDLVLWRPGLTIWLAAWNNDRNESLGERFESIKRSISPERFSEHAIHTDDQIRYRYRLRDENDDGPVESLYAFVIGGTGHLQIAIYFDFLSDEIMACELVDSVRCTR